MKGSRFSSGAGFAWVGAVAVAALSGCGAPASSGQGASPPQASSAASDSAPPAKAAVDVCALITEQEASNALGGSTGPGTSRGEGESKACEYTRAGAGFLQVGVNHNVSRAQFDAAKSKVGSAGDASGAAVVEVPGLGDANFVSSNPHGGGCYVLKGTTLGHVTLVSPAAMASAAETVQNLCGTMGGRLG